MFLYCNINVKIKSKLKLKYFFTEKFYLHNLKLTCLKALSVTTCTCLD